MAITYKDIDLLTQKASIAGTEKLPVSATEYITPAQIAASAESMSAQEVTAAIESAWNAVFVTE